MFRSTIAVSIASLVLSSVLSAQTTFYNNLTAFNTAAGPLAGFQGFNDNRPPQASHNYGPFTIAETNGIDLVVTTVNNNFFTAATVEGAGSIWYDDNDDSRAVFTFAAPINAFGISVATAAAGTMSVFGGAWNTTFALAANQPVFWGVISTTAFTTVTFDMSGGPEVGFDALRFGTTTVVPEPQTWAMLLVGLGAMAVRARRRMV